MAKVLTTADMRPIFSKALSVKVKTLLEDYGEAAHIAVCCIPFSE